MLPLVVVGCTSKQSVSVREATTASGVDNAASPTGRHRWTGLFHPQRERSLCKNNWKEPRSILMSSADRLPISMGSSVQLWAIHALPAEYKCLSNKTEQSIYECLLGFCFNNIFCAATNFGCIDSFLLPETKKWWVMVSLWCYCCRFVLNSKRLLSTSCNKQGWRSSSSIFMVLFRCFLKFAESYV